MKVILFDILNVTEQVAIADFLNTEVHVYGINDLYRAPYVRFSKVKKEDYDSIFHGYVLSKDLGESIDLGDVNCDSEFEFNKDVLRCNKEFIELVERNGRMFPNIEIVPVKEKDIFRINLQDDGWESIEFIDDHHWYKFNGECIEKAKVEAAYE